MTNCTLCEKGSAKEKGNAALCELCAPGSYSDKLGQYICTPCPEDFYCHRGTISPVKCQSYEVCPEGSSEPTECEPPWHKKVGTSTCMYSDTFIAVVSVSSAIVFIMAAAMFWRLYRTSISSRAPDAGTPGEREGLIPAQQGPSYTGL